MLSRSVAPREGRPSEGRFQGFQRSNVLLTTFTKAIKVTGIRKWERCPLNTASAFDRTHKYKIISYEKLTTQLRPPARSFNLVPAFLRLKQLNFNCGTLELRNETFVLLTNLPISDIISLDPGVEISYRRICIASELRRCAHY